MRHPDRVDVKIVWLPAVKVYADCEQLAAQLAVGCPVDVG
jgi:hypothetical protein